MFKFLVGSLFAHITTLHCLAASFPHNGPNELALDSNGFFQLFDNAENASNRAKCMGGERFHQSFGGKSRTTNIGKMSNGYFYGMMLSYAKNVCEVRKSTTQFDKILGQQKDASPDKIRKRKGTMMEVGDALKTYGNLQPPDDPLIQNYSLLLPLGMIESAGKYNEGRDMSAANVSALTAEAGLFQVSYNSVTSGGVPPGVYQELLNKYSDPSKCMTGIFGINQRLSKNTASWGYGPGVEFQNKMKSCPALAVDFMAALLRRNSEHNGPIWRKEARPREGCLSVMKSIKDFVSKDSNQCSQMDKLIASIPADSRANQKFAVAETLDHGPNSRSVGENRYAPNPEEEKEYQEDLAEQKKLLEEAGKKDEAAKVDEEIKAESAEALKNSKDPELIKARIEELEKTVSESEKEMKIGETALTKLNDEAKDLRSKAADEKDPKKKAELEKQADEKEKEAKEVDESNKLLKKTIDENKKTIEELKKKEEELRKAQAKRIEELHKLVNALKAKISTPGEGDDVEKLKTDLEKLEKELAELEKPKEKT